MQKNKRESMDILMIFILVSLIPPDGLLLLLENQGFNIGLICHIFEAISYSVFLFTLMYKRIYRLSLFSFGVVLFRMAYVASDIYNNHSFAADVVRMGIIIAVIECIHIVYQSRKRDNFLRIMAVVLELYIIINFFTILIFPSGFVDNRGWEYNYFLGFKNRHAYYYLLWYVTRGEARSYKDRFFCNKDKCIILVQLIASVISNSSTTMLISAWLLTITLIPTKISYMILQRLTLKADLIITFMFTVLLACFGFLFGPIVKNLFNKDVTFSSRTVIWENAMRDIYKSPILGKGNVSLDINWGWDIVQAHNKIIDLLFVGGIILLICFVFTILAAASKIDKEKSRNLYIVTHAAALGYCILFLMESSRYSLMLFISLSLMYFASENKKSEVEKF